MTPLQHSEFQVLHSLGLTKLPPVSSKPFTEAVVLVRKASGSSNWAVAVPDKEQPVAVPAGSAGGPQLPVRIVRDFGSPDIIVAVDEIRPFRFPDKKKR